MRYLCLAYGDEKDWNALSKDEQEALLVQDQVLRKRGDVVAAVGNPTTVRARDGQASTSDGPFATGPAPLAGFSLLDAEDLDEAIRLVADTRCASGRGAIEVWPIMEFDQG